MPINTLNINQPHHIKLLEKYFTESSSNDYQPDLFPLGYHVRRTEPRLIYVMPVSMVYEGEVIAVKTKNFSATGLQVFIPRKLIIEGKTVQLTFDQFKKEYAKNTAQSVVNSVVKAIVNFESIDYLIKSVKHIEQKTYISLIQKNISAATIDFFSHFIKTNRLRYKIDATDRIYASKAQYYENLYTNNMQHVVMFIRWNQTNGLYIDTIIKTERNRNFFSYFNDDMTSFCFPQRIETFVELARKPKPVSVLFISYWIAGELHTIFDFEIQSNNDFIHIIKKVKKLKGRIYKVSINLNKKPTHEKITAMLSQIQTLDIMESKILDKRIKESIAQLVFTDITQPYLRKIFPRELLNTKNTGKNLSSNVLINAQKVSMSNGHIIESYDQATFHKPETIHFCLSKNRYDERYLYNMDISVRYNRKTYTAKSVDFSRTGLGLVIKNTEGDSPLENEFLVDTNIKITFSNFMMKKVKTELKHISHCIVISRKTDNGLFLGVIRNINLCNGNVNHFFAELVKRSKDTLELCVKDQTDNIYTAFYEAFFTKNIETIPMVIARDKTNHHYIREIGLTSPPCQLSDHFYLQGQGHNYRFLTSATRLDELYQRTIRSTDKISLTFMLFIFKAKNNNGIEKHFSVTDFELIDDKEIKKIVSMVLENNGACIQIQFINNLLIDKLFRKMTIEKVNLLNKSSAKLLSKEYNEIIGFAEMIDLTNEYRQQYQLVK